MEDDRIIVMEPQHGILFKGPYTKPIMSYLKLSNPSKKRVLFKIKTTLPERYLAQPSTGILEAEDTIKVPITLLPFAYDPEENEEHKFMVQAIIAPAGYTNPEALWQDAHSYDIIELKFQNVFEMPEENEAPLCLQESDVYFGDDYPDTSLDLTMLNSVPKPDIKIKYRTI